MLELEKHRIVVPMEILGDDSLSCPLKYSAEYQKIKVKAQEDIDREISLEWDMLSETDGDQWFSHKDFTRRMELINSLQGNREQNLHRNIMHEIFPGEVHQLESPPVNQPVQTRVEAA